MTVARKIVAAVLLLGACAGGYYVVTKHRAEAQAERVAATVIVTRGTIEEVVTAQGKLEPKEYVDVGVQVSGQLKKLHVELGDVVKTGDLIAEIDPTVYVARVQADEARLKTLNAQLAQQDAEIRRAQQQHDRNAKLVKTQAISRDAFEITETALDVARAQKAALLAQIEEATSTLEGDQANLGFTKIYAPMDGTVVTQTTREGQTVNASQTAPTIVQLADLDTMTVRAQVAEADVMRLQTGMDVYFTTLGAQDEKWEGKVRQILPSPEVINEVVLYNVLVDVDNTDRRLMTGMSTQMFFVLGRAEDVLLLPVSALVKRTPQADKGSAMAYEIQVTGQNGKPETRIVHAGFMNRMQAEIRSGLAEGDRVILPAARDGADARLPRGLRGMPRL